MAWKTEEGPRPWGRDPGPRGRNPDPGDRDLEDGSWSNLFMEYFSPTGSTYVFVYVLLEFSKITRI